MRRRWRGLCSLAILAMAVGTVPGLARAAGEPGQPPSADPVRTLRIYYQAPVLVRAGEPVIMPVQVVCVTARGNPCDAILSLGVRSGAGDPWRFHRVEAAPELSFDLTAAAERAGASASVQGVDFVWRAEAGGITSSLPVTDAGPPLRFYATRDIRPIRVPAIPYGRLRRGQTVVVLPWGSGPGRAGLALGRESPALGPPSFDVDRAGRIHLLDTYQGRVAAFRGQQLERQWPARSGHAADLALGSDGTTYVGRTVKGEVLVTRLSPLGQELGTVSLGSSVLSQLRTARTRAYAELLPLDAWVRLPGVGMPPRSLDSMVGRPLPSGKRLLRVGTERSVRLGVVRDERVHRAVELRSAHRFGEVALAEPDGSGGYVVVVRVWRWGTVPADQFQVIHISRGRVAEAFAVSSRNFAEVRPLSRFRLGGDGHLYELVSSPRGVRVVRFELKGES
jgi:hypothetical protein